MFGENFAIVDAAAESMEVLDAMGPDPGMNNSGF
jgi:hypothetical protein